MQTKNYIDLRQERDFGGRISATIEFTKQNFRAIAKSLLIIGSPFIIIGIVIYLLLGSRTSRLLGTDANVYSTGDTFFDTLLLMMVSGVYFLVILNTIYTITYSLIVLYDEDPESINDVKLVFQTTKKNFWTVLWVSIVLFTIFIIIYMIAAFLGTMLIAGAASMGGVMAFIGIAFVVVLVIGVLCYCVIGLSFVYLAHLIEGRHLQAAISRSFELVAGQWWSTFGFFLIIGIILVVMTLVFLLPVSIFSTLVNVVSMQDSNNFRAIAAFLNTISLVGSEALMVFYSIATAVQYFHLVEIKDGVGLQKKIQSLGNNLDEPQEEW